MLLLSPKLKFTLGASLSVTLAFLFPLYFDLPDTTSAAITIMVIATSGTLSNSIFKGLLRVVGTLLGAVIGMALISLFPQERFLYLGVLSVMVTMALYLARAYKGDKTIFLLTAMTMMIVFDGGMVEDIFLYSINKILMTIIGIAIYTAVGIFLLPQRQKNDDDKNITGFTFGDTEDIKGSIITFCVFWLSTFLWIELNIPQGFYITVLATSLSLYTTYSIVKPSLLIILFTFSFIFATLSYIFILPKLYLWWHLALFLFVYTFVGFYFIPLKISVFYLIGMATFFIENTMDYNFVIFLSVLLIFYLFLFILLFFDYFPFSQKPEHMFLKLKDRYIKLLKTKPNSKLLKSTLTKMQYCSSKIDYDYFNLEREDVAAFCRACDKALESKDMQPIYESKIDFTKLKEGRF